ncbi:hypothetical protein GCU67_03640 [Modestobacter muralis]|uniref:Uncharacterized protein n=1 Tax=Modestobacter muralis TaxID=1608614 RepID=A0A6P0H349_9ACTN|nr:hypothetical protein [Modestobacter muralis]NEK93274.1 hypothetical protein [Modestobacter muralis]NEN50041.1 hypothetical protein [Modestobacter muralis]
MLLITCPVTGVDELVAERHVRSATNHPTYVALAVACPCGLVHVYRTGRRWELARARVATRTAAPAERAEAVQPQRV